MVRDAARSAGRPEPAFSVRIQVRFDVRLPKVPVLSGSPEQMRADVDAFRDSGVRLVCVDLREVDPERVVAAIERFHRDVAAAYAS